LKGISLLDATKTLQNEWNTLSAAEKKVKCPEIAHDLEAELEF
jgi:hypothetical protein